MAFKEAIKGAARGLGFEIKRVPKPVTLPIPDVEFYTPLFSPWNGYGEMAKYSQLIKEITLVSEDRIYVLHTLAKNAMRLKGDVWECGVYKGGTARLFAELLAENADSDVKLHLFDTFMGMPETDREHDLHKKGDFADTSLEAVRQFVAHPERVEYHSGWIPDTFKDMQNSRIALAHVDVDIYRSVLDCCEFIYPRMAVCGVMVFDDYGFPSCPGARKAVDEFFENKPETPMVLQNGQAVVTILPDC